MGIECVYHLQKNYNFNLAEYEYLNDLISRSKLKIAFYKQDEVELCCYRTEEFKIMSDKDKLFFITFPTLYLCEVKLSAYTAIETKFITKYSQTFVRNQTYYQKTLPTQCYRMFQNKKLCVLFHRANNVNYVVGKFDSLNFEEFYLYAQLFRILYVL